MEKDPMTEQVSNTPAGTLGSCIDSKSLGDFEVGSFKAKNWLELGRVYDKVVLDQGAVEQGRGLVVSLDELAVGLDNKLF